MRRGRAGIWRAVRAPLLVAAPVAAATAYVGAVDPSRPGHYPACPVLQLFGVYCPGCGGLRAVHALTHGDPLGALDFNAYGTSLIAALTVLWGWWLVARLTGRQIPGKMVGVVLVAALAVMPVFTVVRNLPFGRLLAP